MTTPKTVAHTDHGRHWDRTCPACLAEANERKPLTDEQITDIRSKELGGFFGFAKTEGQRDLKFARAIESAHGIHASTEKEGT